MGGYKAILENEATVEELVDIKAGKITMPSWSSAFPGMYEI